MALIELGGWMMWPLLLVSVVALTVIVERGLVLWSCPFPDRRFGAQILEATRTGDMTPLRDSLHKTLVLRTFADLLTDTAHPQREAALRLAGEAVLARMENRLPLLGVLTRMAPLMGLLGTITGMITTFSRIAGAQSGVDMTLLAGGIWQALLTTATGLGIAIPTLFFLYCFQNRVRRMAEALTSLGNTALLVNGKEHHA